MSSKADIRSAMQKMAGVEGNSNTQLSLATVISVDEANRLCTVETLGGKGNIKFENVQLMASVDDGFLIIPQIDSTVIVSYNTFNQPFICLFSAIEKVLIVAGDNNASVQIDGDGLLLEIAETKVKISDGEIMINDGAMGGLVKVIELTQKLNNLENKVNSIIAKYNSHTHTVATTGSATAQTGTAAPTAATESETLTPTQRKDIENEKVKQG
jgi:hypothetical protein